MNKPEKLAKAKELVKLAGQLLTAGKLTTELKRLGVKLVGYASIRESGSTDYAVWAKYNSKNAECTLKIITPSDFSVFHVEAYTLSPNYVECAYSSSDGM
jgi:hypothetical protein